mgnify:CR=1 FL=1
MDDFPKSDEIDVAVDKTSARGLRSGSLINRLIAVVTNLPTVRAGQNPAHSRIDE